MMQQIGGIGRWLPEIPIPSPFGKITVPRPEPPPMKLKPDLDERRREALRNAVGMDLAFPISWIPVVGDYIQDTLRDLHGAELRRLLTPEELRVYTKYEKVSPISSLALLRSFIPDVIGRFGAAP